MTYITNSVTIFAFVNHIIFAILLFGISLVLTYGARSLRILDLPNERSSHSNPTPRTGGLAIVATCVIGFGVIYFKSDDARISEPYLLGFGFASLGMAFVGLLDDFGRYNFSLKLIAQIVASLILVAFGIVIRQLSLPLIGEVQLGLLAYPITILWLVGMTNTFNFMDGLNGLAAGTGAVCALFFGIVTFIEGSYFVYILCYILIASCLGFLCFNFPKGRIFMGDVGSQFLGFVFAAIAIIASEYDSSRTSFMVMPLLFLIFIYDVAFTFVRRLIRREDVTQSHRSHLYQLLSQVWGGSHVRVTLFHYVVAFAQGLGALVMIELSPHFKAYVFLPFVVFLATYTVMVMRRAKRLHLV